LSKLNPQTGDAPIVAMSPLRRRMIADLAVRNLSLATQRSSLHAVSRFSRYFGGSPHRLGLEDVRAYQVHLVANQISWRALSQTVCALRFFFGVTHGHSEIPERIPYARTSGPLPEVLGGDEVMHFLETVPSLRVATTARISVRRIAVASRRRVLRPALSNTKGITQKSR